MSEDRLEQALEAMREEPVDPAEMAGARGRVWDRLEGSSALVCVEIRPALRDYLDGRLTASRRMLVDDHLGRCTQCRANLAELRGEAKVMRLAPPRRAAWPRWGAWAAAAVLVAAVVYVARDRIDAMLAPSGPRATVASITGSVHRVPGGTLQIGAAIGEGETVRTGPGARAVLRLADGSTVELNERTELLLRSAWSGRTVQLERGDIIVTAAKQRRGQLRVQTRDSVASVKGTVFAVSAGLRGTLVSVVEGAVAVVQPGVDTVLQAGRQAASSPGLVESVQDAVAWSADAERYLSLLASFARIEKSIAELPSSPLRTESRLLRHLPDNMFIYGAIPNPGGTLDRAGALAELEAVENPVFREWWDSGEGRELRAIVDHIRTMAPLLGDEIVFGFGRTDAGAEIPMVLAEVASGKRAGLASALQAVRVEAGGGGGPFRYSLSDTLMVASDSSEHLQWVDDRLGRGAASSFVEALSERYRRGAGWLVGVDVEAAAAAAPNGKEVELLRGQGLKHLFFEQRNLQGADENEVTLTFQGPRTGIASWLASTGSGGAAEYLPKDAILSFYLTTREPRQLFDELVAQLARVDPSATEKVAEVEAKLGFSLSTDLAAALGTETAFALESYSVSGATWVMALLVNDPAKLDDCILKAVEAFNSELGDQSKRIKIVRERVDGRDWIRLDSGASSLGATWTYDRGYLVGASDRGAAQRAISARSGGSALVWSAAFRQQLPSSGGLHPSTFVWLDTKGALQGLERFVKDATLQKLIAEKDPVLVVLGGSTEQIRAASRTRWTGLIIDVMMLGSLGKSSGGPMAPKKEPQRRVARAGIP